MRCKGCFELSTQADVSMVKGQAVSRGAVMLRTQAGVCGGQPRVEGVGGGVDYVSFLCTGYSTNYCRPLRNP